MLYNLEKANLFVFLILQILVETGLLTMEENEQDIHKFYLFKTINCTR